MVLIKDLNVRKILMAIIVNGFTILGIDGHIVKIECDTIFGKPLVSIVGLGDMAVKEARERLEAAMINTNLSHSNYYLKVFML